MAVIVAGDVDVAVLLRPSLSFLLVSLLDGA